MMEKLYVDIEKKLSSFTLKVKLFTDSITGVLGYSGAGKSMTLKCIAGIEAPDRGVIKLGERVLFDSENRINLEPQKRRVGYLFQDYALFPNMTVRDNIMVGLKHNGDNLGLSKKKLEKKLDNSIKEYLERYKLSEYENSYPGELSGGQKQRVAIIRMLAAKPECILLDEPFSALDEGLKWRLENELKVTLRETATPVIYVSHSRDEVYRICDKIGCIVDGRMDSVMDRDEFFQNPGTRDAAVLSGCKNISEAEIMEDGLILARDWQVKLRLNSEDLKAEAYNNIRYVGIRAHDFKTEGASDTVFQIDKSKSVISEDMFEWSLELYPEGCKAPIVWKIPKRKNGNTYEKSSEVLKRLPDKLYVSENDIMLLSK